jgi:hypothetical protein
MAQDFVVPHADGGLPEAKISTRLKTHSSQTTKDCASLQLISSQRGANGSRERAPDDKLRDEAVQSFLVASGLLRLRSQ